LVYAPTGRDAAAAADLLRRAGISVRVCPDYASLLQGLDGASVVLAAEEGLVGQPAAPLDHWISRQPPWSDPPVVMLTSRGQHPRLATWRQAQVERLGNVALLERPVQSITLVSMMRAALRARGR